ncbi:MAG: hypothetical protein AAB382_10920, partial [Chloroflexota bacterium]
LRLVTCALERLPGCEPAADTGPPLRQANRLATAVRRQFLLADFELAQLLKEITPVPRSLHQPFGIRVVVFAIVCSALTLSRR